MKTAKWRSGQITRQRIVCAAVVRFSEALRRNQVARHSAMPPTYFARRPALRTPDDLAHHDCIQYRWGDTVFTWPFRETASLDGFRYGAL